jgi:uncharacterized protein (TIGR02145 family)
MKRVLMALLGIIIATATSFAVDCGDVNNDSYVNILDIVYLINFKYKAGPEPNCGFADVNSDGIINILDIVYLINFKYKAGPEPICGAVIDIDGNVYQTVTIGTQVWMVENLKVTHYRNGDPIPNVTDNTAWAGLSTGAYCEYNNDINNVATYGRLYNWHAVNDSRNIAPAGWGVPTDAELQTLINYLGGINIAGGKMKETGTTHWQSPNTGATNESGFTALPGGSRFNSDYGVGSYASFWSSTEFDNLYAWYLTLYWGGSDIYHFFGIKQPGFSVRCIKRTVTDIDCNVYQTVKIGEQVWMAENLKVTHYRNGDPIPNVTDNTEWAGLSTGAYCEYNNDINNVAIYGRLYNWYAVDDSRNIAPAGWHVPNNTEWQILVDYLGGGAVAGGKMKEAGTTHWQNPNTGATNESGFSALPGGYRRNDSPYLYLGHFALFWSSTESFGGGAWSRNLDYQYSDIGYNNPNKRHGFSIRCVKD